MSEQENKRREFIKTSLFAAIAALPVWGVAQQVLAAQSKKTQPKEVPLPAGSNAVPESDAVASAIGYKANIKEIDYTKYPQRKKPEAKDQFCKNCALYTPTNDSWGKCQMLTSGLVSSQGWCGSWSKKS